VSSIRIALEVTAHYRIHIYTFPAGLL